MAKYWLGYSKPGWYLDLKGEIVLWQLNSGEQIETIKNLGGVSGVNKDMKFSPDGKILATTEDGKVRLWQIP